jgi:hypothetical protein
MGVRAMKRIQMNTMSKTRPIDAIIAGVAIRTCTVARRLAAVGRKGLEKRNVGGGNVRFEINVATQLITPNL